MAIRSRWQQITANAPKNAQNKHGGNETWLKAVSRCCQCIVFLPINGNFLPQLPVHSGLWMPHIAIRCRGRTPVFSFFQNCVLSAMFRCSRAWSGNICCWCDDLLLVWCFITPIENNCHVFYFPQVVHKHILGEVGTRIVLRWPVVSGIFVAKIVKIW